MLVPGNRTLCSYHLLELVLYLEEKGHLLVLSEYQQDHTTSPANGADRFAKKFYLAGSVS